jgi:hypothetical protein
MMQPRAPSRRPSAKIEQREDRKREATTFCNLELFLEEHGLGVLRGRKSSCMTVAGLLGEVKEDEVEGAGAALPQTDILSLLFTYTNTKTTRSNGREVTVCSNMNTSTACSVVVYSFQEGMIKIWAD